MKQKSDAWETVLENGYDCAWILTGSRNEDFKNKVTALLDWKLRGQLTHSAPSKTVVVIPSMGRIPIPYVVLDPASEPDWTAIREKCEGVQWKNLLLVMEEEGKATAPRSYFEKVDISAP